MRIGVFACCALLILSGSAAAVAADRYASEMPGYVAAPTDLLAGYYAEQLTVAPLDDLAELGAEETRAEVRRWLDEHFSEGRRMVVFVSSTSEADRRHGSYFVIATAGLGDRGSDWATEVPWAGGTAAMSGVSIVHLRQTGFVGERFLRAARHGEGLLACNLHPAARWSIELNQEASKATLSVSLGPDAPSRMHALFQDCKPKPVDELAP